MKIYSIIIMGGKMKKLIKFIVILIIITIVAVLVDTLQAKILNNKALISNKVLNDGGLYSEVNYGILVDTYTLLDGTTKTIFKWEELPTDENNEEQMPQSDTEENPYSNDELSDMALDYYLNNNEYVLDKDEYSVGISEDVPDMYKDQNMVVIEIRHINLGNNTLDARYYINIYTGIGVDDQDNEINLK